MIVIPSGENPVVFRASNYPCPLTGLETEVMGNLVAADFPNELTVHFGGLKLLKRKVVPTRAVSSALALSLNCVEKEG